MGEQNRKRPGWNSSSIEADIWRRMFCFAKVWIVVFGVYITCPAPADEVSDESDKTLTEVWRQRRTFLSQLGSPYQRGTQALTSTCSTTWQSVLADGVLDIVLAMGYYEAPWGVDLHAVDEVVAQLFALHLTAPCDLKGYNACGFQVDAKDEFGFVHLSKQVSGGPSAGLRVESEYQTRRAPGAALKVKARPSNYRVRIHIVHSALSWIDADNRSVKVDQQLDKSQRAREAFLQGLQDADIVLYNGHARDGGGPDFFFPRLLSSSSTHVDYPWYQRERPGLNDILRELADPQHKVKILGLFACATETHFLRPIREVARNLAFIGSRKVMSKRLLEVSLMGGLDAFIGLKCRDEIQASLHVNSAFPVQLSGF